jgi:hypothetical protein
LITVGNCILIEKKKNQQNFCYLLFLLLNNIITKSKIVFCVLEARIKK